MATPVKNWPGCGVMLSLLKGSQAKKGSPAADSPTSISHYLPSRLPVFWVVTLL
jgi:hypothetical protein